MTFQPGQSGNPGGLRRKSDDDRKVEELARAYRVEAIKTLASIMRSAPLPDRLPAYALWWWGVGWAAAWTFGVALPRLNVRYPIVKVVC